MRGQLLGRRCGVVRLFSRWALRLDPVGITTIIAEGFHGGLDDDFMSVTPTLALWGLEHWWKWEFPLKL